MTKVKFNVNTEYAYLQNFKVLQGTSTFLRPPRETNGDTLTVEPI